MIKKFMFAVALLFPVVAQAEIRCEKVGNDSELCRTSKQVSFNGALSKEIVSFTGRDGLNGALISFTNDGITNARVLSYLMKRYGNPTLIENDGKSSDRYWLELGSPKSIILTRTYEGDIMVVIES